MREGYLPGYVTNQLHGEMTMPLRKWTVSHVRWLQYCCSIPKVFYMYLKHQYDIPTVIEDLDEVKEVKKDLRQYYGFIEKLNNDCSKSGLRIIWREDINCSQFTNEIQVLPPCIGSVRNLELNVSIDSVKIGFEVFNVEPNFKSKYTQGHTVPIPINKIALIENDYLLVSLLDQKCCWLFKF